MRRSAVDQASVLVVAAAVAAALATAMALMMAYNKPFYAVAGAVSAIGIVLAMSSNVAALCLLITTACLDGLIKGLFPGMLSILAKDILIGWMVLRWMWEGLTGAPRLSLAHPMALPSFLFVMYCTAQMFNSETGSYLVALAGLRGWIGSLVVFFVAYDALVTSRLASLVLAYVATRPKSLPVGVRAGS